MGRAELPSIPGGKNGCAPKPIVRFVTAVPIGTPVKSAADRAALLKYTMLRALLAATSMLNTVLSAMRYRPMIVPSRSATAIAMRAEEPMGRRITARVVFAVAMALLMIRRYVGRGKTSERARCGRDQHAFRRRARARRWTHNEASRETACARYRPAESFDSRTAEQRRQ